MDNVLIVPGKTLKSVVMVIRSPAAGGSRVVLFEAIPRQTRLPRLMTQQFWYPCAVSKNERVLWYFDTYRSAMNRSAKTESPTRSRRSALVPWICLLAAVCWSLLLRVPLILNSTAHMDSDLAVDGLTLQEAVQGHWRWHYPGTPYMGIGAVFLSWPQAMIWGANPISLVSGGTVAHLLVIVTVFALAWRVYGRNVAIGSLLPLSFASTGVLWLSGRITGGHLLTVAWSAMAWLLLHETWVRCEWRSAILLGFWCGLGVYLDSMFVVTLSAIAFAILFSAIAAKLKWRKGVRSGTGGIESRYWSTRLTQTLAVALAFLAGVAPRAIGQRVEPFDAYHEQFSWSLQAPLLARHGRILLLDCLPRLVAGHRLPSLEADPDPALLGTGGPIQKSTARHDAFRWWILLLTTLALGIFAATLLALGRTALNGRTEGVRLIGQGMLTLVLGVVAGFLVNRNIFNSDNYRYLVLLLIPWAIGCGLLVQAMIRHEGPARVNAVLLILALAVLFTCDAVAWYRRLGWIDERLVPIRQEVDDPALRWLGSHPDIDSIFGGYWDVYRLSFLSGGKVKGVPFPVFPNRFPEWSSGLSGGRPQTMLARRSPEGQLFLSQALREAGSVLYREGGLTIVNWPWPTSTSDPR